MLLLLFWSRRLAATADRDTPNIGNDINIQCNHASHLLLLNTNIILLSSTTAAPVTYIPTCKAEELQCCYIHMYYKSDWSVARPSEHHKRCVDELYG